MKKITEVFRAPKLENVGASEISEANFCNIDSITNYQAFLRRTVISSVMPLTVTLSAQAAFKLHPLIHPLHRTESKPNESAYNTADP